MHAQRRRKNGGKLDKFGRKYEREKIEFCRIYGTRFLQLWAVIPFYFSYCHEQLQADHMDKFTTKHSITINNLFLFFFIFVSFIVEIFRAINFGNQFPAINFLQSNSSNQFQAIISSNQFPASNFQQERRRNGKKQEETGRNGKKRQETERTGKTGKKWQETARNGKNWQEAARTGKYRQEPARTGKKRQETARTGKNRQ